MSREKSAHHMVVQRMNSGRREKRPSIEGYIAGTLQAYGIRKGILGQVWARIAGMPGVRFLAIEDSNHRAASLRAVRSTSRKPARRACASERIWSPRLNGATFFVQRSRFWAAYP